MKDKLEAGIADDAVGGLPRVNFTSCLGAFRKAWREGAPGSEGVGKISLLPIDVSNSKSITHRPQSSPQSVNWMC
jgi:hypothetical protein